MWTTPSHYLNQCWYIVDWTLGNTLQWNLNRIIYMFIQENKFEKVVWKMAAIYSQPQCVTFFDGKYYFVLILNPTPQYSHCLSAEKVHNGTQHSQTLKHKTPPIQAGQSELPCCWCRVTVFTPHWKIWKRISVIVCKKSAYPNCSGIVITAPEDL